MKNYQFLQQKYTVNTYPDRALTFVRGDGVYLYTQEGDSYLDLMTNYGVNILGYNHPVISEKLVSQLNSLTTLHGSFNNDMRAEAAQALVKRCGHGLEKVYFANSGTEAVEAALKFAVLATGRHKFISCVHSYHGKTLGALSSSSEEKYRGPFEPLLWDFKHVEYNNLVKLEEALDDDTAAFMVEPVQGEGGIHVPDRGYLAKAGELCKNRNVLMIIDEIQTGLARTGSFLASETEVEDCDIVCLGKGLAGGIPVGATLVSGAIAQRIPRSIHTSTFGGNPLAAAGILAVLDLLDENLLLHIRETGDYFLKKLATLSSGLIKDARGKGLMLGIEVTDNRNTILQILQKNKILAIPAADTVVRFLPAYIIDKEHIDKISGVLKHIFQTYKENTRLNNT